jgi:hypothetical protein
MDLTDRIEACKKMLYNKLGLPALRSEKVFPAGQHGLSLQVLGFPPEGDQVSAHPGARQRIITVHCRRSE